MEKSAKPKQPVPGARKSVLITGASTGIGFELAKLFARSGHDLYLVSKDEARLAEAARKLKRVPASETAIPVKRVCPFQAS